MSVIILLLLASLLIAAGFLFAFLWGVQDHQFDDDYAPPKRILFDDASPIDGWNVNLPENLN